MPDAELYIGTLCRGALPSLPLAVRAAEQAHPTPATRVALHKYLTPHARELLYTRTPHPAPWTLHATPRGTPRGVAPHPTP